MGQTRNYHVKMAEAGYEALEQIAEAERRPLADVVRDALEQYAGRKGHVVSFAVKHGGWRGGVKAAQGAADLDE